MGNPGPKPALRPARRLGWRLILLCRLLNANSFQGFFLYDGFQALNSPFNSVMRA